jgi:hypothetical protein
MPKTLDHEKRGTHDRDDLMDIPSGIPRIIFARREVERNQCQIERDVTTAAARGGGGGEGEGQREGHALCLVPCRSREPRLFCAAARLDYFSIRLRVIVAVVVIVVSVAGAAAAAAASVAPALG